MLYGYPPSKIHELDREKISAYRRIVALYDMDEQLEILASIGGEGWQDEINRLRRAGAVHHEARAEHDPLYAQLHKAVLAWERHPGQTEEEFKANEWKRIAFEERRALQAHMKREKKVDGVEVKKPGYFAS